MPTNVKPSDVRISVRNGSGRTREATTVAASLRQEGFAVISFGDADNSNYTTTVLRYAAGALDKARYVASLVQGDSQLVADSTLTGVDVELVTGQSYGGLRPPGSTATTRTAAPTTSAAPAAPPTTANELPGTPPGFVAPPC